MTFCIVLFLFYLKQKTTYEMRNSDWCSDVCLPIYILDRIQSLVGSKAVILTGYGDQKETLITHLTDNVRDETPDKPAVWTKTAGQDHYFHSMALNMLARRVNEHAYSLNKETTLVSIACAGAMVGSGANDNLLGTGAERISRLG